MQAIKAASYTVRNNPRTAFYLHISHEPVFIQIIKNFIIFFKEEIICYKIVY